MEENFKHIPKIDINNYKPIKELGKGGFGAVYLVEEKKTKAKYAAKVNICTDDMKFTLREIDILSKVNFPTVVKFIGLSLTDFKGEKNPTILLHFYPNGSLLNIRGMKNNTIKHIAMTGVAHGMMILHSLNIIHRDLKVENVLLDEHYYPHITDFGCSKYFDPDDPLYQTFFGGTPLHMAPEIMVDKYYDTAIDVYAFGLLMYEVICDARVFNERKIRNERDIKNLNRDIVNGLRPEFKIEINKELKDLIEQCWDENPNNRPVFQDIYEALSLKHNNDYLLDGADPKEVKKYVDFIENNGTQINSEKMNELELEIRKAQEPYVKLMEDVSRIRKSTTEASRVFKKKFSANQTDIKSNNGVLYQLKEKEKKSNFHDPLFFPSLSSRDPYDVLLPNWIGFYNSSDTGKFFFELQMQGVIYLTGFAIKFTDKGIPKSFKVTVNNHDLVSRNLDKEMHDNQIVVEKLNRPVACNRFKFIQTGPNWDDKNYIRIKGIEFYTKEHPLDDNMPPRSKGFFETFKSIHRTNFDPHLFPVRISTDVFSYEKVEDVNSNQIVGTNHGIGEFCEFKFPKGLVTINSYRLKKLKDRDTLKGWDVIGVNAKNEEVLISSIKEENIDDHELLDFYPSNDNKTKFKSIRIKNTTENWNGEIKKVLKLHHFDFFGDYYE